MTALHVLLFVTVIGAVVVLIYPQVAWQLRAWQYRDPEANHPSEAWFAMQRVGAAVLIVVCLVVWAQVWQPAPSPASEDRAEASATEEAEPSPAFSPEEHTLTTTLTIQGRIHGYTATDDGLVVYVDTGHCTMDPSVRATEDTDTVSLLVRIEKRPQACGHEPDTPVERVVKLEEPLGERRVLDSEGSTVRHCQQGC
ncbi:hypothetical protein A6A08_06750 [Nocardiopsis sp. TSRI0078]|uniref:DUF6199 family natural product biosynthesis protein n=1 Tax=unclassified Nocardiopsis TaxID=2649073 RepID=UPI00093B58D8|nr:DUF6199 family natural product biosynthesis protein [Nocardiopsis sp. TSRI0078]OKI16965.1 hypothetical protein A6A08_06750 [Nocardiopsis sp. TSRI0078]